MPLNFDLIPTGAELDAATINLPLQQLDNAILLRNLTAVTDPTANDDALDGYSVGSYWVNNAEGTVFIATDVTVGAAVWRELGTVLNNFTAITPPTVNDDETQGYSVGSIWLDQANFRSYIAISVSAGGAFWNGVSYPRTLFIVDATGRVIAGSATSIATDQTVHARIQSHTNDVASMAGFSGARFTDDANPAVMILAKSRNTTTGSHTIVQAGDSVGHFAFEGSDGTDFEALARIVGQVDGTPGNNDMPGRLLLQTTPIGSVTPVTRVYIDNAGRVGIGMSPDVSYQLAVANDLKVTGDVDVTGTLEAGTVTSNGVLTAVGSAIVGDGLNVDRIIGLGQTPSFGKITKGMALDQEGNDDNIFEFQSSVDVNHTATDFADAHTFGAYSKVNGANGGLQMQGLSEGTTAIMIDGVANSEDNARNTSATAHIVLRARTMTGTGATGVSADKNIIVFASAVGLAQFIFDSDGNSFENSTGWTEYDDYDDAQLLNLVNAAMVKAKDPIKHEFWDWVGANAMTLQELNLITFNADGHHFINRSKMQELLVGAVRQLATRLQRLEERYGLA